MRNYKPGLTAMHKDYSSRSGSNSYNWKGSWKSEDGVHVNVDVGKYKYEHRLVAEKALGRPLKSSEHVHHINGDKYDNRNCNLLVCTNALHTRLHQKMSLLYAKEHFGTRDYDTERMRRRR